VTLLFFFMADKKAASLTSNDLDLRTPDEGTLTKCGRNDQFKESANCSRRACGAYCWVGSKQICLSVLKKPLGPNTFHSTLLALSRTYHFEKTFSRMKCYLGNDLVALMTSPTRDRHLTFNNCLFSSEKFAQLLSVWLCS